MHIHHQLSQLTCNFKSINVLIEGYTYTDVSPSDISGRIQSEHVVYDAFDCSYTTAWERTVGSIIVAMYVYGRNLYHIIAMLGLACSYGYSFLRK